MVKFIATQDNKSATIGKSMTLYDMYEYIRAHRIELSAMKKQAASIRTELEQLVAEMTYKVASVDCSKKANRLRSSLDEIVKNIRAIEACSKEITGFYEDGKSKSAKKDGKKPFRECVEHFVQMKGSEPFEPTEVARFIAESRGQELTNSLRVFTHRIIKDFVLEKKIVQIAHGLYESSSAINLFSDTESTASVEDAARANCA